MTFIQFEYEFVGVRMRACTCTPTNALIFCRHFDISLCFFPYISSCCLICLWRLSLKTYACVNHMEVRACALCVCVSGALSYCNILIQISSILSIIADQNAYSTSLRMILFQFAFSFCLFIYSLHSVLSTAVFFSYFKSPYFNSITFLNHFGKICSSWNKKKKLW